MIAMGAPWGADLPSDPDSLRELLYVQMWVTYHASSYVTGETSKSTVRQVAALELFQGRAGRTPAVAIAALIGMLAGWFLRRAGGAAGSKFRTFN
jgi:hypothetical protein